MESETITFVVVVHMDSMSHKYLKHFVSFSFKYQTRKILRLLSSSFKSLITETFLLLDYVSLCIYVKELLAIECACKNSSVQNVIEFTFEIRLDKIDNDEDRM